MPRIVNDLKRFQFVPFERFITMHEHDCTVLQVGQLGHGLRHEKVLFFFFF